MAWDGLGPIGKTGLVPQVINVRGSAGKEVGFDLDFEEAVPWPPQGRGVHTILRAHPGGGA